MSATFTLEIQLAPNVEALFQKLLAALAPKAVAYSQQLPPQSPAELAARMRMQQTPAPQRPAPTYAPQQYRPQPGPTPAAPYATGSAPVVPTAPPAAPIRNQQPAPVNPTQAAPMPNNRTTGAANTVPVARPVPLQPAPIASSTNHPTPAGSSTAQPAAAPSNPAPVAAAPAYELDQLARATNTLADANKWDQIKQLWQRFNMQRMDQLPKERYGEYATALRGLGVRI